MKSAGIVETFQYFEPKNLDRPSNRYDENQPNLLPYLSVEVKLRLT